MGQGSSQTYSALGTDYIGLTDLQQGEGEEEEDEEDEDLFVATSLKSRFV